MIKESIYSYYWFGTLWRYLLDAEVGHAIHEETYILPSIKRFIAYVDELGLVVTGRVLEELKALRDKFQDLPEDATLSRDDAAKLSDVTDDIGKVLNAEIRGFATFYITPKVLDVAKLLNDVPALFSPGVFGNLPDIARYDFTEAARCIAFERPTATAFHLLRGTEAVLRHFYCSLIRQKRLKAQQQMWGPIIADLRRRPKTQKHETLYSHLDHIRASFRNPTQHPEKIYDIHEAQDLWSLCIEAVNRMMKTLNP